MKTIEDVVKSNLCIGCGFCTVNGNYRMEYSASAGMFVPKATPNKKGKRCEEEFAICPGKGYNIYQDSAQLYEPDGAYSLDLGFVNRKYVVSSLDERVMANASSGGIMTALLLHLLEKKVVDNVVVTKYIYTDNGPRTKTFFTNNYTDIFESQGSKYSPVNMVSFLEELDKFKHQRFAFVGTPCQIASLRKIAERDDAVKKNLLVTIGNFCGGFKSDKHVLKIAKRHHVDYKNITTFRFRGGGQPGSLVMKDHHGGKYEVPYPNYTGYTGYSKMLRCHLCVDATGELADISCGDAWLEKYMNDEKPWSVVITRNPFVTNILDEMIAEAKIVSKEISNEEIALSQRQNIQSKKYRYISRNKLYRKLGYKLPVFDGGYSSDHFPLKTEIRIFIKHKMKEIIEKIGLYKQFRILIKKRY